MNGAGGAASATVLTARLEMRRLDAGDVDALVELDGFPAVRAAVDPFDEHIPEDPVARREYERGLVERGGMLAAIERASGRFLGWFQLEDRERDAVAPGRAFEVELGYRLRPDAWGHGFATEGAAALLSQTLLRPDVVRVYAHALLSNRPSIKVLERIGMTFAAPWSYRGLPGAEYEARPGTGPLSAPAKRP